MLKTNKMLAGLSRLQCTTACAKENVLAVYRSFHRLVRALITSHLARSSRKVHRSPARNIPYRSESCSQMRMVGYRCGKYEPEALSVLMLQTCRAHNDPTLRGSHPVKTLFSETFFLMAI